MHKNNVNGIVGTPQVNLGDYCKKAQNGLSNEFGKIFSSQKTKRHSHSEQASVLASFINRQGTEQFPMTQPGEYQLESPKLATLILRFNFQTGQASSQIGNIAQASPCDILEGLVFSLRTSCKLHPPLTTHSGSFMMHHGLAGEVWVNLPE